MLHALGIDPKIGGSTLVIKGKITGHRSYQAKDGTMKHPTSILYYGGNIELQLPPDHPIKSLPENSDVCLSQPFIQNQFGWKASGTPILVDETAKQRSSAS